MMGGREFSTYLTYGAEDEKWQLVCVDAGCAEVPPGCAYPPEAGTHPAEHRTVATGRTVKEYQLVYISRGQGSLRVADSSTLLPVVAGQVILVLPGVPHAYRPDPDQGWTERWVGFKGPWADALRRAGVLSVEQPLYSPGLDAAVLRLFEELFQILAEQRPFFQARAAATVMRLVAEILALSRESEQDDDSAQLVERAKYLLAEKMDQNIRVEDLGDDLGVGRPRFYETFKTYTGLTPYQYFIQLKINRARELLSGGRCSVKETAARLGFDDPYYFSRLFKKKTGLSPSRWAQTRREG